MEYSLAVKIGRRIYHSLFGARTDGNVKDNYFGNRINSFEEGNDTIATYLQNQKPFVVSRLGHAELQCLINFDEINFLKNKNVITKYLYVIRGYNSHWQESVKVAMKRNTGYFPTEDTDLDNFALFYFKCISQIDVLGVWYNYFEDEIVKRYCSNVSLMPLHSIEPYYFKNPWSSYLKGKKVLVVHPFEKSIQKQFQIREKLFEDNNVLPDFTLITIKAVLSNAYTDTTFPTWFDALESMQQKMSNIDFDIALIGAGAYGLPLAIYAKSLGKQAIHFGGSLQILFGIKGARWDNNPSINKFYNEYWIRPLMEETPSKFREVEDGCYW
jgi:hypothetical protein